MLRLVDIDETNFFDARALSLGEDQRRFLDSPLGILARGYAYRNERARVLAISDDETVVGLLLVKDMDEAPACYDLQQFMIDQRYQGRGYGKAALGLLLDDLRKERKYDAVEVCVNKANAAALALFTGAGFEDTGYGDPDLPDCLNLMYTL